MALQYLGGVNIRDLSEYVDDDCVHVFESQEGGTAVAQLLFERTDGEFRSFDRAVELMREQFRCDCERGCPSCLYQYGCHVRNDYRTFARDELRGILEETDLTLGPTERLDGDEPFID